MKHSAHQMGTIHPKENAAWFQKRTSSSREHRVTEFCGLGNAKISLKKDRLSQSLFVVCHPLSSPALQTCTCGMHEEMTVIHKASQVLSKGYDPRLRPKVTTALSITLVLLKRRVKGSAETLLLRVSDKTVEL